MGWIELGIQARALHPSYDLCRLIILAEESMDQLGGERLSCSMLSYTSSSRLWSLLGNWTSHNTIHCLLLLWLCEKYEAKKTKIGFSFLYLSHINLNNSPYTKKSKNIKPKKCLFIGEGHKLLRTLYAMSVNSQHIATEAIWHLFDWACHLSWWVVNSMLHQNSCFELRFRVFCEGCNQSCVILFRAGVWTICYLEFCLPNVLMLFTINSVIALLCTLHCET